MKALLIILIILAILFGILVLGAMAYALLVFHHEHRLAKLKSDKYEQHNKDTKHDKD